MRNKIKEFIEAQGITVYEFRKRTGIANRTAYDLVNKPEQYPGRDVMNAICSTFKVQPGDLLEWVQDEELEPTPDPAPKRRSRSKSEKPEQTEQTEQPFQIGALVRNPAGWRGYVARFEGDRVIVDFENQLTDSYPPHLLSPV